MAQWKRQVIVSQVNWVRFLKGAETLYSPLAILHGFEPVSALRRVLAALSIIFFSWMSSVEI